MSKDVFRYAVSGNLSKLKSLIVEDPANVTIAGKRNATPLHAAAKYGQTKCVKYLIKHGADIWSTMTNGDTALSLAALNNHPKTIEVLLRYAEEDVTKGNERGAGEERYIDKKLFEHYRNLQSMLPLPIAEIEEIKFNCEDRNDVSSLLNGFYLSKGHWNTMDVSVKRFDTELKANQEFFKRNFAEKECKYLSVLRHPNIVTVIAMTTINSFDFCVLELLPNSTLYNLLHRQRKDFATYGKYSILKDIASACHFIHSRGLSHNLVNSHSIFLFPDGCAKLGNFELCHPIASEQGHARECDAHLRWMAPEVVKGSSPDHQSDIYSFGAFIWELFSGQPPWKRLGTADIITLKSKDQPPTLRLQSCWPSEICLTIENCLSHISHIRPPFSIITKMFDVLTLKKCNEMKERFGTKLSAFQSLSNVEVVIERVIHPENSKESFIDAQSSDEEIADHVRTQNISDMSIVTIEDLDDVTESQIQESQCRQRDHELFNEALSAAIESNTTENGEIKYEFNRDQRQEQSMHSIIESTIRLLADIRSGSLTSPSKVSIAREKLNTAKNLIEISSKHQRSFWGKQTVLLKELATAMDNNSTNEDTKQRAARLYREFKLSKANRSGTSSPRRSSSSSSYEDDRRSPNIDNNVDGPIFPEQSMMQSVATGTTENTEQVKVIAERKLKKNWAKISSRERDFAGRRLSPGSLSPAINSIRNSQKSQPTLIE